MQLGEGAHGVVYLAKLAMPGDGLYVAVKVGGCGLAGLAGCDAAAMRSFAARFAAPRDSPCGPAPLLLLFRTQVLHLGSDLRSSRFWREVQLLRHCAHPRMVPVYGVALQVGAAAVGVGSGMQAWRVRYGASARDSPSQLSLCSPAARPELRFADPLSSRRASC